LKQNYGLAGQNMIRLWEPGVSRAQTRWIERVIGNGGLVVVEPWLERVLDFSVQLEVLSEGVKFLGYTGLLNDRRGQFEANWAESTRLRRVPGRLPVPFQTQVRSPDNLHSVFRAITKALANELVAAGYLGPVGIDAFVYQTTAGEFRLKPVVEINCRYTLGRLTLELMKHVYPGCSGLFRLINRSKAKAQGFDEFASYAAALVAREPVRLEGSPKARIRTGSICLNDPSKAQRYLALFQVDRSLDRR
jgi:hypothetical protein